MRSFIFITDEGYTFQPGSESAKSDADNFQVLGFAKGKDEDEAFRNLLDTNGWLLDTSFEEVQCLELRHRDYHAFKKFFNLKDTMTCAK